MTKKTPKVIELHKEKPDPDILEALTKLYNRAKDGEIKAIAYSAMNMDGTGTSGFALHNSLGNKFELIGTVVWLVSRMTNSLNGVHNA